MSVDRWFEHELPPLLRDFLPTRRWFGGKGRQLQAVAIEDAIWLAETPSRCALLVVGVRYVDGGRERYVLLLVITGAHTNLPIVGRLEEAGTPLWAVEGGHDGHAAAALLMGFAGRGEYPMVRGGTLRYGDAGAAVARRIARAAEARTITPLGGEQSNTSLRLDRSFALKLFRKVEPGQNPDLEVGRFLTTETTFRAIPRLRGSITYVSATGEASTVAILQDWIECLGDGWTHVVSHLRLVGAGAEALPRDLLTLGALTARFHGALATPTADPAFASESVTAADVESWRASLLERDARTFHLVGRVVHGWSADTRRLGEALLKLRARSPVGAWLAALAIPRGCQKIRIHGDYHLGQVLRTADGFVLIDFEGEPARPLAERRLKLCALKDVAGMIRSFDYAFAAAGGQDSHAVSDTTPARRLRESFLDGYLTAAPMGGATFLPRDRKAIEAWIDVFELEKALYEVEYEINNRPGWVHIPLGGALRIFHRRS